MGKYSSLRRQTDADTFMGAKDDRYTSFIDTLHNTATIQGLPACPNCWETIIHDFLQDQWRCPGCGTVWGSDSLVEALRNNRMIRNLHKEGE